MKKLPIYKRIVETEPVYDEHGQGWRNYDVVLNWPLIMGGVVGLILLAWAIV